MPAAAEIDTATTRKPLSEIPALDGLRGVAVLLVMMQHAAMLTRPASGPEGIFRLGSYGWIGVDVFFVLSGFLITRILLAAREGRGYFSRFYARRALRIFPLYYATLLFLLILGSAAGILSRAEESSLHAEQAWYWGYLVNFLLALHPGLSIDRATGHLWSLAVEEQFYLVWPFLVALFDARRLRTLCVGAIGMAFALRVAVVLDGFRTDWIYTMLPTRVDSLALGALLASLLQDPEGTTKVRRYLPWIGTVSALVIAGIGSWNRPHTFGLGDPKVQTIGFSAVGGIAVFAVGSLATGESDGPVRRWFKARWLRAIGKYSYALYVVHLPIMCWLRARVPAHLVGRLTGGAGRVGFLATGFIASLAIARVTWVLIEQPFLSLKRFFPYGGEAPIAVACEEAGGVIEG
jgi:peptidoglycan/LPS O-acetylase OafA/YrhL